MKMTIWGNPLTACCHGACILMVTSPVPLIVGIAIRFRTTSRATPSVKSLAYILVFFFCAMM
jgi:hypothetical protein